MKKRPLCLTALLAVLLLLCCPAKVWMRSSCLSEGRGSPPFLRGEILRIDPGGGAVYLKHTNASDTGIILVYFEAETSFSIGNTIQIEKNFKLKEPEEPSNPGQFDVRLYYQTKKIVLLCYAEEAELLDGSVRLFPQLFHEIREGLGEKCALIFGEEYRGVISAMLLGDKTELDTETKELYQKSGMSHLLAISGLHVSVFGMTVYRFLRRRGVSYRAAGLPSMALVLCYGFLTGMSTSTARAVIMLLLAITADLLGKSYDMLTGLAFSALLLLAEQPLYAKSASFLLSFGAVLGIGLVNPALSFLLPLKGRLLSTVMVSLSIQLLTLPLIQFFYYEIPVYAVFLNLVVIPLMSLVMFSGILAVGVSFFSVPLSSVPAALCSLLLKLYERLGGLSLRLPGAVVCCGKPKLWSMVLYYAGLAAFLYWCYQKKAGQKRKLAEAAEDGEEEEEGSGEEERNGGKGTKRKAVTGTEKRQRAAALLFLCLLQGLLFWRPQGGLSFTMLDVGQGDALFLRTAKGTSVLIDGGSSDVSKAGTYRILPFLKSQGVGRLDYMIVTHTDADHISGIRELLDQSLRPGGMKIGTLLLSPQSEGEEAGAELAARARAAGTAVASVYEGMVLRDSSASLRCLYPGKQESLSDKNEASVVLRLESQEFSMILTGDLGAVGEREILKRLEKEAERERLLKCDVLKAGHHGSGGSSSASWLEATAPKLALISCGAGNSYGHPHEETLKRLRDVKSRILLTAESGAVTIYTDGKRFWARGFRS